MQIPDNTLPVDGIVLAAGRSTRLGRSKAQLATLEGETFMERAVHLLRESGCRYVVAVVNDSDDWSARLADVSGAAVVINDLPNAQQIDSIRLGIAHLPGDSGGAVVLPVDYPAIGQDTVVRLVEIFRGTAAPVVLPQFDGRTGHPAIFSRAVYGEFLMDLPDGAETLVAAHEDRVQVVVTDPAVLVDVDTQQDYERYLGTAS